MRKKGNLYIAVFWTLLVVYLCLKNADEFNKIIIPNLDKFIHFIFHLVFTILWYLYLKKRFVQIKTLTLLSYIILLSFFFGLIIEVMQQYFTTTRSADVLDIFANLSGALLATLAILFAASFKKKKPIS